jgi:omega-6 fatty acid desaturase (delta-12 desaturase)
MRRIVHVNLRLTAIQETAEAGLASDVAGRSPFSLQEKRAFARPRLAVPVGLFLALVAAYLGLLLLMLAAPAVVSVLLTIPCGFVIAMLFVVGHDAAHNSFTRSGTLNQVLGRLAFMPSLHAFSLWDLSHNRTHHRYNNIRGIDYVWEPMTRADFARCSAPRRALYRFYRTPVGVGFYYMLGLWAPRLFVPLPSVIGRVRLVYWLDSALVAAALALQIAGVIAVGGLFGKAAWASVMVGVVLPFLVWNGAMSFVIFLHHTHPAVRWYRDEAAWKAQAGAIDGTVCVRFPSPFDTIALGIMEHGAHHYASGVPLYNLSRMQRVLEKRVAVVTWRFSWRAYVRICRRCKLYDYDTGKWVSFDGPTELVGEDLLQV